MIISMIHFCPATGHLVNRQVIQGKLTPDDAYCHGHGVLVFLNCPVCGTQWRATSTRGYSPDSGVDFCGKCAAPAPWLAREQLIEWLRNQVQAAGDIPSATRLELRDALERMKAMEANDTRTVAGWKLLRDAAPKVWEASKPVRDALIGEVVKKALGF